MIFYFLGRARNEFIDDEAGFDVEEEEDDVNDEGMYSLLDCYRLISCWSNYYLFSIYFQETLRI